MSKLRFIYVFVSFFVVFNCLANTVVPTLNIPFLNQDIVVDGEFEENVYSSAFVKDKFVQIYPGDNIEPTKKTKLFLFVNKKGIVIAFKCFEENQNISTVRANRDSALNWDYVSIQLDMFGNGKQFYFIGITPMNDISDGIVDGRGGVDLSFDTVFEHSTVIKDGCWQGEILIPFSSLSFSKTKKQLWLLGFSRTVSNKNVETINIEKVDRKSNDVRTGMVYLNIKNFNTEVFKLARKIKFVPSLVILKNSEQSSFDNSSNSLLAKAGLTFEYCPNPITLLKATIHPDFSQIEADGSYQRVNARYPIYLEEKRPFFMDRQESFNTFFNLFYSRNIVQPEYGVKFSSKFKQNMGINYISIVEQNVFGERLGYNDVGNTHNAYWNIFRLTNTIDKKGSTVGISTVYNKLGGNYNIVTGVDGNFKFGKLDIGVQGVVTKTKSGVVSSSGNGLYFKTNYLINQYFSVLASYSSLSPDFKNVAGFYNRVNEKNYLTSINYYYQPQNDRTFVKGFGVTLGYNLAYNYQDEMLDQSPQLMIFGNLSHQINFHLFYSENKENYQNEIFNVDYLHTGISWYENSLFSPGISYAKGDSVLYGDSPCIVDMEMISGYFSSEWNSFGFECSYFVYSLKDKQTFDLIRKQKSLNVELAYFVNRYVNLKMFFISDKYEQRDYNFKKPYNYFNFLFTWQKNAFTKLYIGYNSDDTVYRDLQDIKLGFEKNKNYFIKVTWLF